VKIGVLIKQVPDSETRIKLNSGGAGLDEGEIKWVINPFDEYALEEALRLKERAGGEVVAVTVGPARAVEALRQAMALGVDRGIRIDSEGVDLDSFVTAGLLAAACAPEKFDAIFAGKQAIDDDSAQVHIGVAELLSLPHVSPIEKFSVSEDFSKATVTRPVSGGEKDIVEASLPALFGCEKGLNEPRYASLPGIMKARSKPVAEINASDLCADLSARVKLSSFELPPERAAGRILKGTPAEAAEELLKLLREEAGVV